MKAKFPISGNSRPGQHWATRHELFPLTPALSLRERERGSAVHPLAEGEGWGEGNRASGPRTSLVFQSRSTLHAPCSAAFTLIELLVAVALMSFIVLGLLAMFGQTQRAFKASMTQTDVLESGRIFTDMIARELGQITASYRPATTNLFVATSRQFTPPLLQGMPGTTYKGTPGTQDQRTNIIQNIFFLASANQDWYGIGYQVIPDSAGMVGTLFRFVTNHPTFYATNLSGEFLKAPIAGLNRIADGVVHLRLRAFATNGYPIFWDGNTKLAPKFRASGYTNASNLSPVVRNALATNSLPNIPDVTDYYFVSNALPAYLELEVGILEPHILERFKAIGGPLPNPPAAALAAQRRYLSNHVAQVHIFRQRIPVRTVDFSAYQ